MTRLWVVLVFLCASAAAGAAPRVVVSVKPLHSLVAGVMAGVGEPELLIDGRASPHDYALRPSDARLLEHAQLLFWVGEGLESFLVRPLAGLDARVHQVEVMALPGVVLLHGGEEEGHAGHHHGDADPHVWLDPANAVVIVQAAAQLLAESDPPNAGRYADNARRYVARIEAQEGVIAARLAPLATRPYAVFHDAYRYFERRFGLANVGAVALTPERAVGVRHMVEIRRRLNGSGALCLFGEPQFSRRLADVVLEGSTARYALLDPLGSDLAAGPEAWFQLMEGLTAALEGCLSPAGR